MFSYLIKGAVIASKATPDKNKLSTDTISYSDIQNKADYSANSTGFGIDTKNKIPVTPKIGTPVSGEAESTTKSGISEGTIEVRSGNIDLNELNRNTTESLNALGKIFDKKTVEEKQELADLFGEMAFKAIGDLAEKQKEKIIKESGNEIKELMSKAEEAKKVGNEEEAINYQKQALSLINQMPNEIAKWSDGGSMKKALHAIAGGLMSGLGGGNIASGTFSAWTNETLISAINPKTMEEAQWASMVIGAAAGAIAGGDTNSALSGASTAISATKNNIGLHYTEQQKSIKNSQIQKLIDEGMNPIEAMKTVNQNWKELGVAQGKIYDSAMVLGATMLILQGSAGVVISEEEAIHRIQQQYSNLRNDYPQLTDAQFNEVYAYGVEQGAGLLKLGVEMAAMEVGGRLVIKIGSKVVEFVRGTKAADDFVFEEVVVTGERIPKTIEGASKANKWVDEAGNINWPPNRGFISEPEKVTLKPGTRLDRYGNERGTFVAPEGTPYGMRALPKGTDLNQPYNVYEVVKPIDAMGGKASPWFDEPGLGTQYELSQKISELLKDGYLKRVGP